MKNFILKFKRGGLLLAALVFINMASTAYINGKFMENYSTKKKALILLPIIAIGLSALLLVYTKITPAARTAIIPMPAGNQGTQDEQQVLSAIVKDLDDYARNIGQMIDAFFDTKNNQSYGSHVLGFKAELAHLDEILNSLHTILNAKNSHSSAVYTSIVQQADTILHDLRKHLLALFNVLEKHKVTKKIFPLIGDLKKLEGPAKEQLRLIEQKVQNLYTTVLRYSASLAQQVNGLRAQLHSLAQKSGSLTGLSHRIKR